MIYDHLWLLMIIIPFCHLPKEGMSWVPDIHRDFWESSRRPGTCRGSPKRYGIGPRTPGRPGRNMPETQNISELGNFNRKKLWYLCWKKIIRTSQNIVGSFMKSEYIETSFRYFLIPLIAGETWDLQSPRQLSHPRGSGASFRSRPVRYADPGSWPTGLCHTVTMADGNENVLGKPWKTPWKIHMQPVSQVCGLTSFWVFGNLALKNPQTSHVVLSNYVLKFFCLGFSIIKTYKSICSHLICKNFQKNHEKPNLFCIKFPQSSMSHVACESMRPKKSMDPLGVHRTKSPVRYKRGAAPGFNGPR
jgi:hypothetical protein